MKKIVLTFGLIAGVIMSAMMALTIPFHESIGMDKGLLIGYTSMVLSFLLVYFGVRSYRDNVAGGTVGFGRALAVGALIGVVASLCYVATWEVIYFNTDFGTRAIESYQADVLKKARAGGATEEAIATQRAELEAFAEDYRNPAINAAYTFMEPMPVAIIVALVTAGVLSRRKRREKTETGLVPGAQVTT
jgi:hypothetical protein